LGPEHVEYFERVTEEIALIHRDLDIQVRRFAHVQMELDQLRLLLVPTVAPTRAGIARLRKQAN